MAEHDGRSAPVVGMVGAGQLARMTSQAATDLGIMFRVLADSPEDSAAQVCAGTTVGDYRSPADLLAFAKGCDAVTFDHEHVPGDLLAELVRAGVPVHPGPDALYYAQDKLAMRTRLSGLGVPCPRFAPVASLADVENFADEAFSKRQQTTDAVSARFEKVSRWPGTVVLKATRGGYDGKGVWVCQTPEEAGDVLSHGIPLIAEDFVPFDAELAALVARSPFGQGAAYPVVQTVQQDGICREVIAPAPGLDSDVAVAAQSLALRVAEELGVTGLLAVELFLVGGRLLVNELAMRPHNCGHWTIQGSRTSQFEQHLRAVLDLPLGATEPAAPQVVMANVLGGSDGDMLGRLHHVLAADPALKVHLYGKQVRPGRKIGHVTALGTDVAELRDRAVSAAGYLRWGEDGQNGGDQPGGSAA